MYLKKYQQKRKFEETLQPKGKVLKISKNRFVIHNHFAERAGHHHDLRLEMEGVLKSWAAPKGIPEKKGIKHLAIQTEDHPVDYINFKGEIPKGLYGTGTVKIFDKGKYKLKEKGKDRIIFELKGKKLNGDYCLIKFKKNKQWLIFKIK